MAQQYTKRIRISGSNTTGVNYGARDDLVPTLGGRTVLIDVEMREVSLAGNTLKLGWATSMYETEHGLVSGYANTTGHARSIGRSTGVVKRWEVGATDAGKIAHWIIGEFSSEYRPSGADGQHADGEVFANYLVPNVDVTAAGSGSWYIEFIATILVL